MIRSGFNYLKGNCPICNGARKDCHQSRSTSLIHCRHSEANPPDYIYRGQDKQGFGMWAEKAQVEAASEQKQEEWRQQRRLEKQRRLAPEHCLTDYLEFLEEQDIRGEEAKLFGLTLAQHLQRGY